MRRLGLLLTTAKDWNRRVWGGTAVWNDRRVGNEERERRNERGTAPVTPQCPSALVSNDISSTPTIILLRKNETEDWRKWVG